MSERLFTRVAERELDLVTRLSEVTISDYFWRTGVYENTSACRRLINEGHCSDAIVNALVVGLAQASARFRNACNEIVDMFDQLTRPVDGLTEALRAELNDIVSNTFHQVTEQCPISFEVMFEPVQTPCGHVCEREHALTHFHTLGKTTCFFCGTELGPRPFLFPRPDSKRPDVLPRAQDWWKQPWQEVCKDVCKRCPSNAAAGASAGVAAGAGASAGIAAGATTEASCDALAGSMKSLNL